MLPVFGVNPVAGRDHAVGSQRRNHAIHNVLFRQPKKRRLLPVHIQLQPRITNILRNQYVAYQSQAPHLGSNLLRDSITLPQVHRADANIERRRLALVHHRVHQSAGLKIRLHIRDLSPQLSPHPRHIHIAADRVLLLQAHLDKGVIHRRVCRVNRGKIRIHADIRHNHVQVRRWHHLPDNVFNLRAILVRQLQPSSRRRFHVDHKLARISARKECQVQQRIQRQADDHEGRKSDGDHHRPIEAFQNGSVILQLDPQEKLVESPNHVLKRGFTKLSIRRLFRGRFRQCEFFRSMLPMPFKLDELRAEQRHHRHRHNVGGEHGQHHRQRQRGEQVFAHAVQQHHREKYDRPWSTWPPALAAATSLPPCSAATIGFFAHFHVPKDVLQHHHGVVDQPR